jgi:tetratricopeptide (TPR) repeat protein
MITDINIAEAERLKAEGNDLYSRGEYDAAKQKFTEAIEKNPTNAILYANRAAVHLSKNE